MAARKEILSDLSSKIADGNIRDAYRTFEELPVVDQIAVSISPGVGDALAAYEVGEFGARAKTNIQDEDYLGATGNYAMAGLSLASLYPLFRFLRGARGITKSAPKLADAPPPIKPPTREPLQLAPTKKPKIELPKVQPFQPKGISEISYETGDLQLGSKARKWINGIEQNNISFLGKKVQKLPVEQWVKKLVSAGIPKGELRLLRILDESNEIHPKFLNETAGTDKISRGFLDDYMARSQRDAIQVRATPDDILESQSYRPDSVQTHDQYNYYVRGSGEYRDPDFQSHNTRLKYPDNKSGVDTYVFDAAGPFAPGRRFSINENGYAPRHAEIINKAFMELDISDTSVGKNLFRMQSDFQREVSQKIRPKQAESLLSAKANFKYMTNLSIYQRTAGVSIKDKAFGVDSIFAGSQKNEIINQLKPEFADALRAKPFGDEQAMRKILGDDAYKTFTDTGFAQRIPSKFFEPNGDVSRLVNTSPANFTDLVDDLIETAGDDIDVNKLIKEITGGETFKPSEEITKVVNDLGGAEEVIPVIKEIFNRQKNVAKIQEKIFKGKPTGFIKPAQQKEILQKLKGYNKRVDEVNTQIASGVNVDVDRIIGQANRSVTDLGIDKMSISPRDIEKITGKPFTQSLDKTSEEIFNMTSGPLGGRQKYFDAGPRLEDRVKAYFDDIADEGTTFFKLANGVKVLKKAVSINSKEYGMKIDPYFDGGNSKYARLPTRANILQSSKKGDDFMFLGDQQAVAENFDTDTVFTYLDGQNEIKKVLKELGVPEEGVVKTIADTGTEFDGTYLKFTDELKKAIEEQGINAFKDGGPVDIDKMLAEL